MNPAPLRVRDLDREPSSGMKTKQSQMEAGPPSRARLGFPFAVCLGLTLAGNLLGARSGESGAGWESLPAGEVFEAAPLRRIKVEVAGKELTRLREDNRRYVRGTFWDGDTMVRDVGVHLKGAAGSFRGLEDRPALTVNFDKFVPDQHWHGLQKIHLNNSVQDGSYLTENLCGELFRQAGVPAARAANARLIFNGKDLGIYVLREGYDRTFLRQYYGRAKGNLYDGGFCRDITEPLEKICGNAAKDQPEIKALVAASREPNLDRRIEKLKALLDLDRFVSFCALEVMTWDWDGYLLKPNNYKLYWDDQSRKITFLPHGMDQMFWEPNGPIHPAANGLVARSLLETSEGRRLYRARMTELTTNVFQVAAITNRLYAYAVHVRNALAERDPNAAREYDGQVQRLRDLVVERAKFLTKQLVASPVRPLQFQAGVARVTDWFMDNDPPVARLERGLGPEGRPVLAIRMQEPGVASWRSRVQLPAGRYRFEAMARSENVAAVRDELGQGAGLRISGARERRANQLAGTAGWRKLEYEFEVASPGDEVVLVCELRASRGQVWFDADSLQVRPAP